VEVGQLGHADANHPSSELLVVACGRHEELCELANE
jgi:hypothetical protein